MKDDFSPHGLKSEWTLLIHGFIEENTSTDKKTDYISELAKSGLKQEDIKLHIKSMSQSRKLLNNQIEKIKADIEHLTGVIENLELVGSDTEGVQTQISDLNTEGEKLSNEIFDIDRKIKKMRELETILAQVPSVA